MMRLLLGLVIAAAAMAAGPPVSGPTELTVAQKRQLSLLDQKIGQAGEKGEFEQAHEAAADIVKWRTRWQGARHWETIDARLTAESWQRRTKVARKDRPEVAKALRLIAEGNSEFGRGQPREGLEKLAAALAIRRSAAGEDHPDTATSYQNLGYCMDALGQAARALPLHEKALEIRRKALGEDHPNTAASFEYMASCLQVLGQAAKALPLHEKALEIRRRSLGEDHPHTAQSYSNLAYCLQVLGQAARALPLHERALAITRRARGEDHPHTGTGYGYVASCLQVLGQAARALPLHERALAITRRARGDDHPDTAINYSYVASCLDGLGQSARALPLYEKALAITRKARGDDHPDTAQAYNSVASCLGRLGQPARTLLLHEKALAIRRKSLGEEHPHTAQSYNNLAYCLQELGQAARALKLYEKALEIRRKALGEDHPTTAQSYGNLGCCLDDLGQAARALPLHERSLAITRKALGEDHPHTAQGYNNVASTLRALGQAARALPLHEKDLAITRRVLGEDHPHTATSFGNLASCLQMLGQAARALPPHEKALEIRRKALGEGHTDTATSHHNLASCLDDLGQAARALPLHERGLAIRRKALGDDHPDTASSYGYAASCLDDLGQSARALPLHERCLAIRRKALGEGHPHTATSYNNLAYCLQMLGQAARALPLHERALEIRRKALGEGHPDTAQSYANVASCSQMLGQAARALPLHERALEIRRKALGEDHPETATSYNNLAYCLERLRQSAEGILMTQASLSAREAARFRKAATGFDRSLASAILSPHAYLAYQLPSLRQPRNAFRHAEAFLARGLLDDLIRSDPEEARDLADLDEQLMQVDRQLVPLFGTVMLTPEQAHRRDGLAGRRRALMAEQARLATAASTRQLVPQDDIQAAMPADAALVLWVEWKLPGKGTVHPLACVLPPGPPVWVPVPARGKEWEAADAFLLTQAYLATIADSLGPKDREKLIAKEPEQFRALATEALREGQLEKLIAALRKQRIEPLLPHLEGVRHFFVVPTGRMAAFPVELLAPELRVSYIPSGSFLHRTLKSHRVFSAESMLALGDPVFSAKAPEPPEAGLAVAAVVPGGAGARAGFRTGDVLVRYEGKPVRSEEALLASGAGRVHAWRDGKVITLRLPAPPSGIVFAKEPPRIALAKRRELETPLVSRGTGHRPLPGSAYEVKALSALVKNTTALLGTDASERALDELIAKKRLKGFRVLHFATHGEVNEQLPDRSCLILAQDALPDPDKQARDAKAYDGRLTVETIRRDWDLDADLVVLSACQTALGKDRDGDGLLGFAHAFLARGARTVVLSRWKVDDGATALLMVRFYENLLGKRGKAMGRAAALQDAKDWLRTLPRAEVEKKVVSLTNGRLRRSEGEEPDVTEDDRKKHPLPKGDHPYAAPYYWAAWALVGDPD